MLCISVTEKSVAEVVYILLDRYDRNITHVTDSRQYQLRWQSDLASRMPVACPKGAPSPTQKAASGVLEMCLTTNGTGGIRV